MNTGSTKYSYLSNPYLEAVGAALLAGFSSVFIKYLQLQPTSLSFFRFSVPTLVLLVYFTIKKIVLFKGVSKTLFFASFLNAIRVSLYYYGFLLTTIGNAVIALYTWPIFAVILSRIFLKEKLPLRNIILLITSFTGIVLIYSNKEISFHDKDFIGLSAILLHSIIYAFAFLIFKKEAPKYSKWQLVFYQSFIGAIIFPFFIIFNRPLPTVSQTGIAILFGLLIGLVVFGLFSSALKKAKLSIISIIMYLEVVSAIFLGWLFFKETLELNVLIGGILMIGSTILLKKEKEDNSIATRIPLTNPYKN